MCRSCGEPFHSSGSWAPKVEPDRLMPASPPMTDREPQTETGRRLLAQFRSDRARRVKDYPVHWLDAADIRAIEAAARAEGAAEGAARERERLAAHFDEAAANWRSQAATDRRSGSRSSMCDEQDIPSHVIDTARMISFEGAADDARNLAATTAEAREPAVSTSPPGISVERKRVVEALYASWPGLSQSDVRRVADNYVRLARLATEPTDDRQNSEAAE